MVRSLRALRKLTAEEWRKLNQQDRQVWGRSNECQVQTNLIVCVGCYPPMPGPGQPPHNLHNPTACHRKTTVCCRGRLGTHLSVHLDSVWMWRVVFYNEETNLRPGCAALSEQYWSFFLDKCGEDQGGRCGLL